MGLLAPTSYHFSCMSGFNHGVDYGHNMKSNDFYASTSFLVTHWHTLPQMELNGPNLVKIFYPLSDIRESSQKIVTWRRTTSSKCLSAFSWKFAVNNTEKSRYQKENLLHNDRSRSGRKATLIPWPLRVLWSHTSKMGDSCYVDYSAAMVGMDLILLLNAD